MNANVRKTNGVKLLAVVAVLAMVVCAFAAIMPAEQTDAAPSGIPTEIGGGITPSDTEGEYVLQQYNSGEVIAISHFTIPNNTALVINGAKFTVNEGVTITIEAGGQLILMGASDVTINGNIVAEGTDPDADDDGYVGAIVNNVVTDTTGKTDTGVKVNGDITLERGAEFISASTGTVGSGTQSAEISAPTSGSVGNLVLQDGANLSVTKRSSYISYISGQTINMVQGASFRMNGYAFDVTVNATGSASNYTYGSMTIDSGFELSNIDDLDGNRSTSDLTFTVTTQNTSAWNAASDGDRITLRQYVLNVDGTVDGATITTTSGEPATTTTNVYADTLTIAAGGSSNSSGFYEVTENNGVGASIKPMTSVSGSLSVTGEGKVDIQGYVLISGSADIGYNDDSETQTGYNDDNLTISDGAYLNVTGTITVDDGTGSFNYTGSDTTGAMIYIDGGSIDMDNAGPSIVMVGKGLSMYGAFYYVESTGSNTNDSLHFRDLVAAVNEGAEAGAEEVYVISDYGDGSAQNATSVDDAIDAGAYVLDQDLTIPDGITLYINHVLAIDEAVTLTFADGAEYETAVTSSQKTIYVGGKLVDEGGLFERSESYLFYEVKKLNEDETVATYTTLAIALREANPGESIELNGTVRITENLVIPADVTVIADDSTGVTNGLDIVDATLTVNGILNMSGKIITFSDGEDDNSTEDGTVVVNNYIVNVNAANMASSTAKPSTGAIAGAHYYMEAIDDYEEANVISSVAVAAENSSEADSTNGIVIYGNVNMGDVTFTAATDDRLTVYIVNAGTVPGQTTEVARAGTVTFSGAVSINTYNGDFTGSITGADATISLTENRDMLVSLVADESGETVVYDMVLSTETGAVQSDGTATVVSGTVQIADTFSIAKITINNGAELVVPNGTSLVTTGNPDYRLNTLAKQLPLITESLFDQIAGLVVEGTLTVDERGSVSSTISVINGTVAAGSTSGTMVFAYAYVNGTLDVADDASVGYQLMIVNGTVNGAVEGEALSGLMAFPGASIDGAQICYDGTTESQAELTTYYVNGAEYATVYALGNVPVDAIALFIDAPGYDTDTARFYSDEGMKSLLSDVSIASSGKNMSVNAAINAMTTSATPADDTMTAIFTAIGLDDVFSALSSYNVGEYPAVYVAMDPSSIPGTITTYNGLTVYIDGLSLNNLPRENADGTGKYLLDVGSHEITVQINPAYTGTYEVTLNGQAVTGNTFEITGDMTEFQIVVTGNLTQQSVVIDGGNGSSSDGMGLTDYLLIILVILIVVMAIMVAMRLMRS